MAQRTLTFQWMSGLDQIKKKMVSAKLEYRQLKELLKKGTGQGATLSTSHPLSFQSVGPFHREK